MYCMVSIAFVGLIIRYTAHVPPSIRVTPNPRFSKLFESYSGAANWHHHYTNPYQSGSLVDADYLPTVAIRSRRPMAHWTYDKGVNFQRDKNGQAVPGQLAYSTSQCREARVPAIGFHHVARVYCADHSSVWTRMIRVSIILG